MNFLVAYPATWAAKRERLIVFRWVIEKKRVAKKNVITKDGVNRIPTIYLLIKPMFGVFTQAIKFDCLFLGIF